jgi:serine/threonine protein kinase
MNPNYNEFRFPQIKSHPWSKVFSSSIEPEAVDLISGLLKYSPTQRYTGLEAMGHAFFAEILKPDCKLPNGASSTVAKPFVTMLMWMLVSFHTHKSAHGWLLGNRSSHGASSVLLLQVCARSKTSMMLFCRQPATASNQLDPRRVARGQT